MGHWTDRSDLTPAQTLDTPPVWLLACLIFVWLWSRAVPILTAPVGLLSALGALMVLGGIALMVWAVLAFRAHQTSVVPHQVPARIITSGPFHYSRNPIYLGDLFVLGGAVFWWGAWPALALIPLFVWILTRRFIAPEEERMKESFGEEFDTFAEKTPRWL